MSYSVYKIIDKRINKSIYIGKTINSLHARMHQHCNSIDLPVDKYILSEDKPIYILDATAALYMIPIERYNKDYDMFLKGNIGVEDEEGQIEKLKNTEDVYILVMRDKENRNWQTPTKVLDYIEENYEIIDTVSIFDVYYIVNK